MATVTEKKRAGQSFVLPHPKDVELTSGLPTLVCGIVTDLIWCTGESAPKSAESYLELLSLPRQLQPWLTALDADAAGKQKDTLYKGLYKCVSVLVANPVHYGDHLAREFSILTLRSCAASSSWRQYVKVKNHLLHVPNLVHARMYAMIIYPFFFLGRFMLAEPTYPVLLRTCPSNYLLLFDVQLLFIRKSRLFVWLSMVQCL